MSTRTSLILASVVATLVVGFSACSGGDTEFCQHMITSESGESALGGDCYSCSPATKAAVGGLETMVVASTLESFTVESSNPTRLQIVSQTPQTLVCMEATSEVSMNVKALAAGDVIVLVKDADGEQIDSIAVALRDVATMTIERDDLRPVTADTPVEVEVGNFLTLSTTLRDASGEPLYADASIVWTVSNTDVIDSAVHILEPDKPAQGRRSIWLYALTPGTSELTVEHAGTKRTITINVVNVVPVNDD